MEQSIDGFFIIKFPQTDEKMPFGITTNTNEIYQHASILESNDKPLLLKVNSVIIPPKQNAKLEDIGFCPQDNIEMVPYEQKVGFFLMKKNNFVFQMDLPIYFTVFDVKIHFSKKSYTVPQNLIIKFEDSILSDDIFLFSIENVNKPFEIDVKDGYSIYYSYFNHFHFICLPNQSTLKQLKETICVYSRLPTFNIHYGKQIQEFIEKQNISDADNTQISSLNSIPILDFDLDSQNDDYDYSTISVYIKNESDVVVISYNPETPKEISGYALACILERDYGIDRHLFELYNESEEKLKIDQSYSIANISNVRVKISQKLHVKVNDQDEELDYLTTINNIKYKYEFQKHNFGILINNQFATNTSSSYLLVHYLNDNENTNIRIIPSKFSYHEKVYSKLFKDGKSESLTLFLPDSMLFSDIARVFLNVDPNFIKIIENRNNKISYEQISSKVQKIKYIFEKDNKMSIEAIYVNVENPRLLDLIAAINTRLHDTFMQTLLSTNSYYYETISSEGENLPFWKPLAEIKYDDSKLLTIKELSFPKSEKLLVKNIMTNEISYWYYSHPDVKKMIWEYKRYHKLRNIKLRLFYDFHSLNDTDNPTLYKPQYHFMMINKVFDDMHFFITNGSPLKFQITVLASEFENFTKNVSSMFGLNENQVHFRCNIDSQNILLPPHFTCASIQNESLIEIDYEYEKRNVISVVYKENDPILIHVSDIDLPIKQIKREIQKRLGIIWNLSLNSFHISFQNFILDDQKPISEYKLQRKALLQVELNPKEELIRVTIQTKDKSFDVEYTFSQHDAIDDVKEHLKEEFQLKHDIQLQDESGNEVGQLTDGMVIIASFNKVSVQCQGSIGDQKFEFNETEQIKNVIRNIHANNVSEPQIALFHFNEKENSFDEINSNQFLHQIDGQIYCHKFVPNLNFTGYGIMIPKEKHISEMSSLSSIKQIYIEPLALTASDNISFSIDDQILDESKAILTFSQDYDKINMIICQCKSPTQ